MNENSGVARVKTGVRNLDALFLGGLPKGTVAEGVDIIIRTRPQS